jgi:hypothetical protein
VVVKSAATSRGASMKAIGITLALCLGAAACDAADPVPAKPTWVNDVEPIMRGNCFHCHGVAANYPVLQTYRWDFYSVAVRAADPADPSKTIYVPDPKMIEVFGEADAKMFVPAFTTALGAKDGTHFTSVIVYATNPDVNIRMPPPPASPLADRDVQVIKNWMATGFERGVRMMNKAPTADWLSRPKTIVVSDGDHEQVLGKLTCGSASAIILSSGMTKLPDGWQPPCMARLFDGQDAVNVNLP